MKKNILLILLLLVFFSLALFAGQDRQSLSLAATGINILNIDCGAGWLNVQGVAGMEQIEVTAVLNVRGVSEKELSEFKKEFVTLKLEKIGAEVLLVAKIESGSWLAMLLNGNHDARIDLEVRLPRQLSLKIDDGSGDTDIRDIDGGLELDDGSGDIQLTGIKGEVKIVDGSGDIKLTDSGDDVTIDDGSGQIKLIRILGSVEVEDGSGDIIIDGVEKNVTIIEAGSGDLDIRNVKGQVKK